MLHAFPQFVRFPSHQDLAHASSDSADRTAIGRPGASPILDPKGWIRRSAIALSLVMAGACSSESGSDLASDDSEIAIKGRWTLPDDVRAIGADVRVDYDDAPFWSPSACSGGLETGSAILREHLQQRFEIISSIGGYSCRRNTANTRRLSVHGTGRALDIFVPRNGRAANNTEGDPVANWLVVHAQEIGVQLIIWDHSIWRANGTNEKPYGGPIPHTDHIHAELTEEAAANTSIWFATDDADGGVRGDGGEGGVDPEGEWNDGGELLSDASDSGDAAPAVDAATPTPDPELPVAPVTDAATPPSIEVPHEPAAIHSVKSVDDESTGDEPAEPSADPLPGAVDTPGGGGAHSGCATANGPTSPGGLPWYGIALVVGLSAWRKRRQR